MVVYQPGEYFDESKSKELSGGPINVLDLFSSLTLSFSASVAVPVMALGGDFVTGGIVAGAGTLIGIVSSVYAKKARVESNVAKLQNNRTYAVLPKGINKTLLPFGKRLFPAEFRVESIQEKSEESINRSFSRKDPRNLTSRSYVVKTVNGKMRYCELPSNDPLESWDKLFKQETGEFIDSYRAGKSLMYRKIENPNKAEVTAAKVKTAVDKVLNKETPIWIEEVAKKTL